MDDLTALRAEIDAFVDGERPRRLWWVRPDFRPHDDAERLWALEQIQRSADRATFVTAGRLKAWLSRSSSAASAAS